MFYYLVYFQIITFTFKTIILLAFMQAYSTHTNEKLSHYKKQSFASSESHSTAFSSAEGKTCDLKLPHLENRLS